MKSFLINHVVGLTWAAAVPLLAPTQWAAGVSSSRSPSHGNGRPPAAAPHILPSALRHHGRPLQRDSYRRPFPPSKATAAVFQETEPFAATLLPAAF